MRCFFSDYMPRTSVQQLYPNYSIPSRPLSALATGRLVPLPHPPVHVFEHSVSRFYNLEDIRYDS